MKADCISGVISPLFSVIVPVYNVKGYVEKTVESILAQTFEDYELLLVDDGSSDGCGAYIDNIAAADMRVKAFHQSNSGVSAARNLGLEKASGKWVVFVDGDDALVSNALQILADCIARHTDVDLIGYGFERVLCLDNMPRVVHNEYEEIVTVCSNMVGLNALNHYMVWGEAFRREAFADLRFEHLKNGEDVLFCNALACRSKKYMEIGAKLYLYLQREASARVNVWSERRLKDYTRMNNLILANLYGCAKTIDKRWLRRWVGSLLQYVPQIFQLSETLQNQYFSQHRILLKKVKGLQGLPLYLELWIALATAINSKSFYRRCAMRPMSLYARLINR